MDSSKRIRGVSGAFCMLILKPKLLYSLFLLADHMALGQDYLEKHLFMVAAKIKYVVKS